MRQRPTAEPQPSGTRRRPRPRAKAKAKKSKLGLWAFLAVLVLAAIYAVALDTSRPHVEGRNLRFDTFVKAVNAEQIKTARVLDQDAFIVGTYQRPDRPPELYNAPLVQGTQGDILELLVRSDVPTTVDQQVKKRVLSLATTLLPGLILVVLFVYLIVSSRRKTGLFAIPSGARKMGRDDKPELRFADVAGQEAAVAELREIQEFLSDPDRFLALGAAVPKGVLLYGPPGCGKTMLARALAGEAGASFFSISGSDFVELYVGVGASRVRDLFREARENAPALIFIDELDSIGRARGNVGMVASHGEQEQALNQVLAEMDGFSPTEGIIVLGATNRPDVLDQALLRPGRFDRTIGLEKPDQAGRLAILAIHARNKSLDPDVDLAALARKAIGLTGADLASVMNEGALGAARAHRTTVSAVALDEALQRILGAPERQRRLSLRERSVSRRFAGEERASFADIAGQDEAVAELAEIKEFLVEPERFAALGASVPRGVLLYGPPGCGKTLLARALAGEANAAFFSVAATEFVEVFVGKGAARVRQVFAEARSMAPTIVFIDELDAIGRARGTVANVASHGEQEQALNQILAEMDGFSPTDGVLVLGATNRPEILDPALLRPGRFDRTVGLSKPDEAGRLAILSLHARAKTLAGDVDLPALARPAIGLTGADLASVMNEGALLAARAHKTEVTQVDLEAALSRILEAPERQRRLSMRSERAIGRRFSGDDRVSFADVAGLEGVLGELSEVRDYLADPERYTRIGASFPRGILLSGPPGCGKTLLARAVAGEANAAFFSVAASEFVEVFVGEGASRVRDLFHEARSMAPTILFIDEIDAVGARRSGAVSGSREMDQTLNQILLELDGFTDGHGAVIVMAATNRPDLLDPALVRPGRFDRHIAIPLPDRAGRLAILGLHGRRLRLGTDVDLDVVARLTQGFSGADLANVLNESALLAARQGLGQVSMALVDEGLDRAMMGVSARAVVMSDDERRIVAFHEAGHALVARALPGTGRAHRLTIVPRGGSLGHCTVVDDHDHDHVIHTRSALLDQMAVALGGRVAEELAFGEAGSTAGHDLARAGEMARRMVCQLGMGESVGMLAQAAGIGPDGRFHTYSDEAGRAMESDFRALMDEALGRAHSVLSASSSQLEAAALALLERETLTAGQLDEIVGPPVRRPSPLPGRPRRAARPGRGA